MGVFDDKKFEELDWISQATEPIDSMLNEVLEAIPEKTELNFQSFTKNSSSYSIEMSIYLAIANSLARVKPNIGLSSGQLEVLSKYFKFVATSPTLIIDYEKQEITGGEIFLIKTATTMEEKDLVSMLGKEGIDIVTYNCQITDTQQLSRCNEVMEILGKCNEGIRTKSYMKKRKFLVERLRELFKENEWNIRDTELANRVGRWIRSYISDGEIAAFSNVCKLKVMTHKGQPIYSMEEIV